MRLNLVLNQRVTADLIIPVLDREEERTATDYNTLMKFTKFEHEDATNIRLVRYLVG